MDVRLLAYTPNPDRVCAAAAYTSHKKEAPKEDFKGLDESKVRAFLRKVIGWGHLSVVEHASFTFSVEGISRACTHQLVRHRIASYTQQSQRYVKFSKKDLGKYITPKSIKGKSKKAYKKLMDNAAKTYTQLVDSGVPAEDARYVLPNASPTNIVVTMNGRELLHFFGLRLSKGAQWEIKELAKKMLKEARKVAPGIFENAGPQNR